MRGILNIGMVANKIGWSKSTPNVEVVEKTHTHTSWVASFPVDADYKPAFCSHFVENLPKWASFYYNRDFNTLSNFCIQLINFNFKALNTFKKTAKT
jgi:hypothetical protein